MNSIPIADPSIGDEEIESVANVIADGQIADGPEVRRFEEEFADYHDGTFGIAVANGTAALQAALHAVGITPGDRVVTTPFSFVATANAIRQCGATPIFADIDPETYNLDPTAVEAVIRDLDGDVDAILPVHLYGLPASMDPLLDIADTFDLSIVEDAAQAHGAEYDGRPVGSLGDAGCFSFYPTKNMTTGEGGMIVTDRNDIASRARRFINHGRREAKGYGYVHVDVGYNFRMTSIAAAIGRKQLDKLPAMTRARRRHADTFSEIFTDTPGIEPPVEPRDRTHSFNQYTLRVDNREAVRSHLGDAGVSSAVYYPTPIHRQPSYDVDRTLPKAENASDEVLSLPVHPQLTADDVSRIAETVRETSAIKGGIDR